MSYGVALRNGVPFTLGTIAALCVNATSQWSPLALWPDGVDSPGMWIDPSLLTASFNDYAGTTPVATPGSVADSANPVGLALDIRAGATVLTDPGHHMLQSTSAARPLESARVNLLTRTEDFATFPPWYPGAFVITSNSTTAPDGTLTADTYIKTTAAGFASCYQLNTHTGDAVFSFYAKYAGHQFAAAYFNGPDRFIYFDVLNGVVGGASAGCTPTMESVGNGWYRCVVAFVQGGLTNISFFTTPTDNVYSFVSDGTSGCYFWGTQLEPGTTATPYQPIPTDGSSYTSTGITPFQLYDGVDDGMATAAFTAGTLINGMDCMIPVRRDSGANAVCGLYESVSDANKVFGIAESGSSSGCVGSGAGTPTVWVDNTQLTGGTAVTRGTLHTALSAGDIHILEFRGLDLSTWTAIGFGLYTSYKLLGARGDIMLYPSTASTEDKDAARQYLADKYGVTLA